MRLPRHLRDLLLDEMELNILEVIKNKEIEHMTLSDVFYLCALLANLIYGLYVTRYVSTFANFCLYGHQYAMHTYSILGAIYAILVPRGPELYQIPKFILNF